MIYQGFLVMELKSPFFPSGTMIGIGAEKGSRVVRGFLSKRTGTGEEEQFCVCTSVRDDDEKRPSQ